MFGSVLFVEFHGHVFMDLCIIGLKILRKESSNIKVKNALR